MSPQHSICDYSLLILDRLLAGCSTSSVLRQAIASYPEDTKREGHVRQDMLQFVSSFPSLAAVVEATRQQVAERGGREALEARRDRMEFDEFLYGWDE